MLFHKAIDYGRSVHRDAVNFGLLWEEGTEFEGLGFWEMVGTGGTKTIRRNGDGGGGSIRERGEVRRIG